MVSVLNDASTTGLSNVDLTGLVAYDEFWKNGLPLHVDIISTNKHIQPTHKQSGEATGVTESGRNALNVPGITPNDSQNSHLPSIRQSTTTNGDCSSSNTTNNDSYAQISSIDATRNSPNKADAEFRDSNRLLERWSLSFEANGKQCSDMATGSFDDTDLILLVQSVYSQIRSLPLSTVLLDTRRECVLKHNVSLADGSKIHSSDPSVSRSGCHEDSKLLMHGLDQSEHLCGGFDSQASLKVLKFRHAATCIGTIHVSLVYDASILSPVLQIATQHSPSSSTNTPVVDYSLNATTTSKNEAVQVDSAVSLTPRDPQTTRHHYHPTDVQPSSPQKSPAQPQTVPVLLTWNGHQSDYSNRERRSVDMNRQSSTGSENGVETTFVETPLRRNVAGSPFPSPTMQKRTLAISNNRLNVLKMKHFGSINSKALEVSQLEKKEDMASIDVIDDGQGDEHSKDVVGDVVEPFARILDFTQPISVTPSLPPRTLSSNTRHWTAVDQQQTQTHPIYVWNSISTQNMTNVMYGQRRLSNQHLHVPTNAQRRDSLALHGVPDLFGSLVGSYEESILSGRMSTYPSKPITFLAEIGVMGYGKCRASLKCPAHLVVPFPAFFYQLLDDENPSTPYVGTIEVDRRCGIDECDLRATKKAEAVGEPEMASGDTSVEKQGSGTPAIQPTPSRFQQPSKKQGNCGYRLPFKGQIQIVIKNPSRTAIKVFLVPYDFRDMPPSSKTFLRQKSYATRNRAISPNKNKTSLQTPEIDDQWLNQDINERTSPNTRPKQDRMRYAIHLQFQCTDRRHLYLCKTMRVVFSHRAPDTDETLRTICEGPTNPRYILTDTIGGGSEESHGPTESVLGHEVKRDETVYVFNHHRSDGIRCESVGTASR